MINLSVSKELILVSYLDKDFTTKFSKEKLDKLNSLCPKYEECKTKEDLDNLLKEVEIVCTMDFKQIIESEYKQIYVNPLTGEMFLNVSNGDTPIIPNIPLPETLVERIKESLDKNLDITPIIKCWARFLSSDVLAEKFNEATSIGDNFVKSFSDYINKKYVVPHLRTKLIEKDGLSFELATELATVYEVKITKEGLLQLFKTSTEIDYKFEKGEDEVIRRVPRYSKRFDIDTGEVLGDNREDLAPEERLFEPFIQGQSGDAFYCEGPNGWDIPKHFIRIGHKHRLPDWSFVNTDDSINCVKGLHVGSLSYIAGWGNECTDIHCVLVKPEHIGAICSYSGDSAIRVLEYYVNNSLMALNKAIFHSSEYGALTISEWKDVYQKCENLKK